MFNDRYGLTEAVLSGRKTQTRRIAPKDTLLGSWKETEAKAHYKVGEVVAVAQSYNDFYDDECDPRQFPGGAGWTNKMFVCANLMPHQIRITNVRVERLQEISDADCIAEGVELNDRQFEHNGQKFYCARGLGHWRGIGCDNFNTPREAYAALIDRISGKGTWERNPWVFVYDFELIKS